MSYSRSLFAQLCRATLMVCAAAVTLPGQVAARLNAPVNPAERITIPNSVPAQLRGAQDLGRVSPSLPMKDLLLRLEPNAAQRTALDRYLEEVHNPASATYRQWLTPAAFGERFGIADADVATVTRWLESQGFEVSEVAASKRWIRFSGSAGQVEQAFRTEIHRFNTASAKDRIANARALSLPSALAPAVAGLVSVNNFEKKALHTQLATVKRSPAGKLVRSAGPIATTTEVTDATLAAQPSFTSPGSPEETFLAPGDFARIYNTVGLTSAGTDGRGTSIAIVGRSDISLSDVEAFRAVFRLPFNDPKMVYVNGDPGVIPGDDEEAVLDTEWSGAVAPQAIIHYVIGSSTNDTDGVDLSAAYIVDHVTAPIMSVSFGSCEQGLSQSENDFYRDLWQQAAAEGITVLVAAGDSGSSACDVPSAYRATPYGFGVSGLASTPYNVAVGGTEFADTNLNTYWNITPAGDQSTAKGYIPEMTWNESCNVSLPVSLHNCYFDPNNESTYAGGGGTSSCSVHPDGDTPSILTGLYSCQGGYPEPSWQTGPGVPQDGSRHLPDVSLAAAGGHDGYLICYNGSCQWTTNADGSYTLEQASVIGGTSAASPSMAGILALVEQRVGQLQGQINYKLYPLAAEQNASATCDSSTFTNPADHKACAFHDVTANSNTLSCLLHSNPDCTVTVPGSTTFGLLSGYSAKRGYDQATGLGSVDAANLVRGWSSLNTNHSTSTTLSLSRTSFTHGNTVTFTANVLPLSGSGLPTGDVVLRVVSGTAPVGPVVAGSLAGGRLQEAISSLPGGTYQLVASYGGDATYGASTSAPVTLTVAPESSVPAATTYVQSPFFILGRHPIHQGSETTLNTAFYVQVAITSASGAGVATGTVALSEGAKSLGTYPLDNTGTIYVPCGPGTPCDLVLGHHVLTARYSGSSSLTPSTTTFPFTLDRGAVDMYVSVSSYSPPANSVVIGTVAFNYDPAVLPTGYVRLVRDDTGATLGGGIIGKDGNAVISFRAPAGTYNVLPVYGGDANYRPGIVRSYPQISTEGSGKVATFVSMTLSSPTSTLGGRTQVNVAVTPTGKGAGFPTGTVTLYTSDGGQTQPYPLIGGHLSTFLTWSGAGSITFYATYNGDQTFAGNSSHVVSVNIAKGTPTLTLKSASRVVPEGAEVSVSAFLSSNLSFTEVAAPTGVVQFYDSLDGGTPHAIGPPQAINTGNGDVLLATVAPVLSAGNHIITAVYRGDLNWNSADARAVAIEVVARK